MAYVIGFVIAVVIALTGVGAGTITAPLLILFLHIPGAEAVGTALGYATIVKCVIVPVQIARKQVSYRVFGFMLLGGGPGVLIGSLLFRRVASNPAILYWILGTIIVFASLMQIASPYLRKRIETSRQDRLGLIAALMFPIGGEVGLSSSGAGALGTLALLSCTSLAPSQVVGTDLLFGLVVAMIGSGVHFVFGAYNGALLVQLVAGGVLGAIAGSTLAPFLPSRYLRVALACWLLLVGTDFCFRAAAL